MPDKPVVPIAESKVPIARVLERRFTPIMRGSFPATVETVKVPPLPVEDTPKENVMPLSWWRRMIGKKAG